MKCGRKQTFTLFHYYFTATYDIDTTRKGALLPAFSHLAAVDGVDGSVGLRLGFYLIHGRIRFFTNNSHTSQVTSLARYGQPILL